MPKSKRRTCSRFTLGNGLLAITGSTMACMVLACVSQSRPVAPAVEGQSYADALRLICDVDRHVSIPDGASELEVGQLRDDYIVENTKNPDAIYFVTVWRTKPPAERASLLDKEAQNQKIRDCALASQLSRSVE